MTFPHLLLDDDVDVIVALSAVVMSIHTCIGEVADFYVRRVPRHFFVVVVSMLWALLRGRVVFLNDYDFLVGFSFMFMFVLVVSLRVCRSIKAH